MSVIKRIILQFTVSHFQIGQLLQNGSIKVTLNEIFVFIFKSFIIKCHHIQFWTSFTLISFKYIDLGCIIMRVNVLN